jgi:hypothetical protein
MQERNVGLWAISNLTQSSVVARSCNCSATRRSALQAAERAGWRGGLWPLRYYRDRDPSLDSIRNDPEFQSVFADIERDMTRQRAELAARPKDAPLHLGSPLT